MQKNKALIISIFLSFLAIVLSIFAWMSFVDQNLSGELFWSLNKNWFFVMILYFLVALTPAIIGLIIGVKKIKMLNRMAAILTIIIAIISIIVVIFSWFAVELSIFARTT